MGTMEAEMAVDVREEIKETLVPRVVNFLRILKFPNMPRVDDEAEVERMNKGIGDGDKNYVYPILQWALQDFAKLSKRAYLAKYLVPEQIPQEFMQDEVLVEIHTSHKELQMQFKVYAHVEEAVASDIQREDKLQKQLMHSSKLLLSKCRKAKKCAW